MKTASSFLAPAIRALVENNTFVNLYDSHALLNTFNNPELEKHYAKMHTALNMDESDFSDDGEPLNPMLCCLDMCYYEDTLNDYPELVLEFEAILKQHRNWSELQNVINDLLPNKIITPLKEIYRLVRSTRYKFKPEGLQEDFDVCFYDLNDPNSRPKAIYYRSYSEMVQHFADYPNNSHIETWVERLKTAHNNKGDTRNLSATEAELQNTFIECCSNYILTYAVHFDKDLNPVSLVDAELFFKQHANKQTNKAI